MIATGISGTKFLASSFRCYTEHDLAKNGFKSWEQSTITFESHAEMVVLKQAQRGDLLEVIRWIGSNPEQPTMAKPCKFCQDKIKRLGIRVKYTDWNGDWETLL